MYDESIYQSNPYRFLWETRPSAKSAAVTAPEWHQLMDYPLPLSGRSILHLIGLGNDRATGMSAVRQRNSPVSHCWLGATRACRSPVSDGPSSHHPMRTSTQVDCTGTPTRRVDQWWMAAIFPGRGCIATHCRCCGGMPMAIAILGVGSGWVSITDAPGLGL